MRNKINNQLKKFRTRYLDNYIEENEENEI